MINMLAVVATRPIGTTRADILMRMALQYKYRWDIPMMSVSKNRRK
jgi:hypothetical protein